MAIPWRFRSYYAFARGQEGGLRTSTGIPTSVCYGFLKSLMDMMEAEKPQYAAVVFDLDQPTFRHKADETYKDGRPETPEGFLEDVQNLKELLTDFGLNIFTAPGFEADDCDWDLATQACAQGFSGKDSQRVIRIYFSSFDDDECITGACTWAMPSPRGLAAAWPKSFKIEGR